MKLIFLKLKRGVLLLCCFYFNFIVSYWFAVKVGNYPITGDILFELTLIMSLTPMIIILGKCEGIPRHQRKLLLFLFLFCFAASTYKKFVTQQISFLSNSFVLLFLSYFRNVADKSRSNTMPNTMSPDIRGTFFFSAKYYSLPIIYFVVSITQNLVQPVKSIFVPFFLFAFCGLFILDWYITIATDALYLFLTGKNRRTSHA